MNAVAVTEVVMGWSFFGFVGVEENVGEEDRDEDEDEDGKGVEL